MVFEGSEAVDESPSGRTLTFIEENLLDKNGLHSKCSAISWQYSQKDNSCFLLRLYFSFFCISSLSFLCFFLSRRRNCLGFFCDRTISFFARVCHNTLYQKRFCGFVFHSWHSSFFAFFDFRTFSAFWQFDSIAYIILTRINFLKHFVRNFLYHCFILGIQCGCLLRHSIILALYRSFWKTILGKKNPKFLKM